MGRGDQTDAELLISPPPRQKASAGAADPSGESGGWEEALSALSEVQPGSGAYERLTERLLSLLRSRSEFGIRRAVCLMIDADESGAARSLWRISGPKLAPESISDLAGELVSELTAGEEISEGAEELADYWGKLAADGVGSVLPSPLTDGEAELAERLINRGGAFERSFSESLSAELARDSTPVVGGPLGAPDLASETRRWLRESSGSPELLRGERLLSSRRMLARLQSELSKKILESVPPRA